MGSLRRYGVLIAVLVLSCAESRTGPVDDDFCHGRYDGVECDDGNPCTKDDVCGKGVCRGRPGPDKLVCDDADPCTTHDYCARGACVGLAVDCSGLDAICRVGACDSTTGECVARAGPDGEACDDGDPCTTGDACGEGTCVGQARDCSELDAPCRAGACDPGTGECVAEPRPDDTPCGEEPCVVATCRAGECHEAPACAYLNTPCRLGFCDPQTGQCRAEAKSDGAPCDDEEPCTSDESCRSGECIGTTHLPDGSFCEDEDPCTDLGICGDGVCHAEKKDCSALDATCVAGACSPTTGDCVAVPLADGSGCTDGDPCTEGDTCQVGECQGGEATCPCHDQPEGTTCDDGDPCTTSDQCSAGACEGKPKDCSSLDGVCVVGACEEGECHARAEVQGTPCDDQDPCTENDGCFSGACVGAPIDCSALDLDCTRGVCEPDTGLCAMQPRPDLSSCESDDPCAAHAACSQGACVAASELCASCEGKTGGDACDDGNPCTAGDTCAMHPPTGLLHCEGTPLDCGDLDTGCRQGVCDPSGGECTTVPVHDGTACTDGDPCTLGDSCKAGSCAAAQVDLCGDQTDRCEPDGGDTAAAAIEVPLDSAGTHTVLAWSDNTDHDWFAVPLTSGDRLSVSTRAHCGTALDTFVVVLRPDGTTPVAQSDDADGPFSAVEDVVVDEDGRWLVHVTAFDAPAPRAYLLEITRKNPPPCATDADCACADLECLPHAGGAKACTWTMAGEVEPNDQPDPEATPLVGEVHGSLHDSHDHDVFAVELQAGQPVRLETRAVCGEPADTAIVLRAPGSYEPLVANDDGGEGHFSLVEGFVPPVDGIYHVEVHAPSMDAGQYVLSVSKGWCTGASDCTCTDRACSGDADQPGVCVPKHHVPEPPPGELPELAVGVAIHAEIAPAHETDGYTVALTAGTTYDLRLMPFCGEGTDAQITLLDPTGTVPVAKSAGHSATEEILGLKILQSGTYHVQVKAFGAAIGEYRLVIEASDG